LSALTKWKWYDRREREEREEREKREERERRDEKDMQSWLAPVHAAIYTVSPPASRGGGSCGIIE